MIFFAFLFIEIKNKYNIIINKWKSKTLILLENKSKRNYDRDLDLKLKKITNNRNIILKE